MMLSKRPLNNGGSLALITDVAHGTPLSGAGFEALQEMEYVGRASGSRSFWTLLTRALEDETIHAVAVSLNRNCVLDNELPARLEQAYMGAAGDCLWAVLGATGKCMEGNTYSVVYPSAAPRLFLCNIPRPIIDCGLELFVLNANFLRGQLAKGIDIDIPVECFPQWCILTGYLEGHISVFRPELAIGVNGSERGRDASKLVTTLQNAFGSRLPDDTVPSLIGRVPLAPPVGQVSGDSDRNPRPRLLKRALTPLADLVHQAAQQATTPMSLSIVTRTRFTRTHLLKRMLASVTRARQQLDLTLEVVLSSDIDEQEAREAHQSLQADFPELELVLQLNRGKYPHSRVDNLVGGILAARKDYVAIIDDDDFVDLNSLYAISGARLLGHDPILLMSSQVCDEVWREASPGRWVLESSLPAQIYRAEDFRRMFLGSNQLPVCSMVAPRPWLQARLEKLSLRHDLSEDYAIYLALLTAPDLPMIVTHDDLFCMVSSRSDGTNTITMNDRRPWVRDITLFLHDLFVTDRVFGAGAIQMVGQVAKISPNNAKPIIEVAADSGMGRQSREIAMLKAEVAHLHALIGAMELEVHEKSEALKVSRAAEAPREHKAQDA